MSTVTLQKAITPPMSAAYLERGLDRVAGFVVPAADVAAVTSTAALFELHGLGFPGSPFAPDRPIDILHLPASPTANLVRATGGADEAGRRATGGPFLDRPPFTGTGLAAAGDVVAPLSWLEHTRLTPGARLWRFTPGAEEPELVGTYHGVAFGWQNHLAGDELHALAPSKFVGPLAKLDLGTFAVDVRTDDDGAPTVVTLVTMAAGSEEHGFTRTNAGTWAKQVPAADVELFEIHATARWHGLPVRIVDQGPGPDGEVMCRVSSLAYDADAAERMLMDKIDAGVYETTAALSALTDVRYTQRVPNAWAKESQLAEARAAREAAAAGAATTGAAASTATASVGPAGPAGGPVGAGATAGDGAAPGGAAPSQAQATASGPLAAHGDLLERVARGLATGLPAGWTRVRVLCRMAGSRGEILGAVTGQDGKEVVLPRLADDVGQALSQLRHVSYNPGEGTWFTALATLAADGTLTLNVDSTNEPKWSTPIEAAEFAEDVRRYPRDEEHTPDWLRARLAEAAAGAAGESGA
ncbi:hypothetical protein GCM10009790_04350 [Georgenia ruanii]|uniref:hypothetical protein n=1 Tax=Georgenia ruanii TaxID=348442 RepID=UPI0031E02C4C